MSDRGGARSKIRVQKISACNRRGRVRVGVLSGRVVTNHSITLRDTLDTGEDIETRSIAKDKKLFTSQSFCFYSVRIRFLSVSLVTLRTP